MKYRNNNLLTTLFAIIFLCIQSGCTPKTQYPPILILGTNEHFGSYTSEILKTEGFNTFQMESPQDEKISLQYLKNFNIVILGESTLTDAQKGIFEQYVDNGGNLVAFRPDKKLNAVLGITDAGEKLSEGYLSIDPTTEIGKGLLSQKLQFHGDAHTYTINSAKTIATLYASDSITSSSFPAVTLNEYGKGRSLAFLYNLPESIIYTRQGNYRDAGKEMDGITGLRAMDLFTNEWVNASKNTLNQADEQMRLLSHGIEYLSAKPMPRFWYFPDTLKCLVTLHNDGEDSKEAEFEPQFADVHAKGAKMTLYIKETDLVSKEWVNKWSSRGFEISGHPDDTRQAVEPDWKTMDSVIKNLKNKLNDKYGIPVMHTVTNHWFVWPGNNPDGSQDFAAQARIEENNGIRLDCNYAHYDNGSNQGAFLGQRGINQGNYTGSGLPMKYSDIKGKLINVYQQLNNVYDQQYMEHKDPDGYFNAFKGLMDRSLDNEVYSFVSIKAHNNEYFFSKTPLMNMLDYANNKGIPVWTELNLLNFLQAKDEASFKNLSWKDNILSFEIHSSINNNNGITCMIPSSFNGKKVNKIQINGTEKPFSIMSIKGTDYAWVTVKPGTNYKVEASFAN